MKRKGIKIAPNDSDLQYNLAKALSAAQNEREALQHHLKATQLAPDNANAWVNYGKCLDSLGKVSDALVCYEKAIELQPNFIQPWFNKGKTLSELGRYQEALSAYTEAYRIKPEENFLLGILLHHKMLICEWTGLEELYQAIHEGLAQGNKVAEPFGLMAFSESEQDKLIKALDKCFNLKVTKQKDRTKYRLYIKVESKIQFINLIKEYIFRYATMFSI